MWKSTHHLRTSALPAIAAALALSSTPVLAQEAQPVPTDSTPATSTPPTTETAPATPDASTPLTAPADTSSTPTATDTSATTTSATTTRARPLKHATHVAAATPPKVTTRAVTHATAAHVAAAAPARAAAPAAPAPAAAPATTSESAVQPVVDLNSKQAKPATTASAAPRKHDETVPIAAGGVVALLAIGGAAVAMNRRRDEDEEEWVEDDSIDHEPIEAAAVAHDEPVLHEEQPAIVAPPVSAFAWGNSEPSAVREAQEPMVEQDDRQPGETWVERAYRGPSPLNPSVSLKTRLRRAAFFDKRERQAAEGLAAPVDPTAGLPDRMVGERETELA